MYFVDKYITN